ncbi:type I polyketide synthase [Sorangium sp. So ce1014]|uniref:type I polyketide synthase n=1 Tax=Sorangium sp. So ce1014 TaxID=3133326 RepID=UPI003F5DE56E
MSSTSDIGSDELSPLQSALFALRKMRARLDAIERARREPIAIVGAACRFPGASDPESFWSALREGRDAVRDVPKDRWDIDAYYDPTPGAPGKMYTRRGAFLDEVDRFDAGFFGVSPREAEGLDPQQRLLLEVSWEALERAAIAAPDLAGTATGVFVGIMNGDYGLLVADHVSEERLDGYVGTGNGFSFQAGRLSYVLGVHGPCMALDTACSSSLVAIHLACQSLRDGECRVALAGGVNLILSPRPNIVLSHLRALAPDGRSKAFDASADGYGRGEGCGVVVLKRLSDALTDGDPIVAVIRGSAVNHDGPSGGLTVPNGVAQRALIRRALEASGVEASQVSYIEAHGTGTALGDPIELNALGEVFGPGRSPERPLWVGAVKANIGHLEAAAGVAGVLKVALAMQHGELPVQPHLRQPSPHVAWAELPVRVPMERTRWPSAEGERRVAGVSSFGMSGINAHVVLEEAPSLAEVKEAGAERPAQLLCMSAKREGALRELAGKYAAHLGSHPEEQLGDVVFTAHTGRAHFAHRLSVVASSRAQMQERLSAFARGEGGEQTERGQVERTEGPRVAFLFTGQGSQYVGMGQELFATEPVFRRAIEECDALLRGHLERSLIEVLYPAEGQASPLDETEYTQPALFAVEYALSAQWKAWGIEPFAVLGHSVGEYVAACVAGVFGLSEGIELIATRGRLMQALPKQGAMAALFADEATVAEAVRPYAAEASIAAVNGPSETVVSGARGAVTAVVEALGARGVKSRWLNVSHAFHSPLMAPMVEEFERAASKVKLGLPQRKLIANVTGRAAREEVTQALYWASHVRAPVRFLEGIRALHEAGAEAFVEVGPSPVLSAMGQRCVPDGAGVWLPSLRPKRSDCAQMLESLGALYVRGAKVDFAGFDRDRARRKLVLPTYPFQRERYWFEIEKHRTARASANDTSRQEGAGCYEVDWQPRPHTPGAPVPAGSFLLLADRSGVGEALARKLVERGHRCVLAFAGERLEPGAHGVFRVDPARPEDLKRLLVEALPEGTSAWQGVVHLWSLDAVAAEGASFSDDAALSLGAGSVLGAIQALAGSAGGGRLWVVTRDGRPAAGRAGPGALSWGLGRVIALEHPELWGGLIDLDTAPAEVQAERLGETLLEPDGEDQIAWREGARLVARLSRLRAPAVPPGPAALRPDASYLITGGLGGLGLQVARWMTERGARNLVLVGRRSPPEEAQRALHELEAMGARVLVAQADVGRPEDVARVLSEMAAGMPPLGGVVHAAGVLDDGVLQQLDGERFRRVLAPKAAGAWNLHVATRDRALDFFVLFSSAAGVLGSLGQGSYAAANAFLDALAVHRRALGLAALSIAWGPWDGAGMAGTTGKRERERWHEWGIDLIPGAEGLALLERLLAEDRSHVVAVNADWGRFARSARGGASLRLLSDLVERPGEGPPGEGPPAEAPPDLMQRIAEAEPADRRGILLAHVRQEVARVLGFGDDRALDARGRFADMGMDSLMAVDLKNHLQRSVERALPATLALNYPSIEALTSYLEAEVLAPEPAGRATEVEALGRITEVEALGGLLDRLERLSNDDVERMLARIASGGPS